MKKIYALFLSILLFAGSLVFTAFQEQREIPVEIIKNKYLADLGLCNEDIRSLKASLLMMKEEKGLEESRELFRKARLSYKRTEVLATYYDAEFIRYYINGAPLPSLEFNAPSLSVLEPEGFQPLEELLFDMDALEHKEKINALADALENRFAEFVVYQQRVQLHDRHIFEALRFELLRIFTMGVTGFDSPAILFSIPESAAAMEASWWLMQQYIPLILEKDTQLAGTIESNFSRSLIYLHENQDFEEFDRVEFLTDYINPLFKQVVRAQLLLGIETIYEVYPTYKKLSINYLAEDIFSDDLLNPFFYTRMGESSNSTELVELGKILFFDPILSANNQRSCASCHNPEMGFADGKAKSLAMDFEGTLDRNAPGLINAVYSGRFFYDLRTEELEDQIDHVVTGSKEFHTNYTTIIEKLEKSPDYLQMFSTAFPGRGEQVVSRQSISTALASYLVSLSSFNSPFDRYVRGEGELTEEAIKGANLFMGKAGCATCHFAPVFNGLVPPLFHENESEVLGVPSTTDTLSPVLDPDRGRAMGVLKERADIYEHSFKTTTVRNAALTAPYMHNGIYPTLEEVVDFYDRGGGQGMGLDVPNQTLPADRLELSKAEKKAIVKFMESLSDTIGLTSPPEKLPAFPNEKELNARLMGGSY